MSTSPRQCRRLIGAGTALLIIMGHFNLTNAQQETPPPPSEPRPVRVPKAQETALPNGLRVIVIEKSDIPLVSARLLVKSGAETDPADASGLAEMTADLVTKGTRTRSAPEIAQAVESLGGSLQSGAAWDSSNVYVNVMASKFEPALAILADVVRDASFNQDEIDRVRQQTLDSIKVAMGEPGAVASLVAARVVFGNSPYGHPRSGTPESVARITRDDIVRVHRELYRPDNAVLVIGGDVDAPRHSGSRKSSSATGRSRPDRSRQQAHPGVAMANPRRALWSSTCPNRVRLQLR